MRPIFVNQSLCQVNQLIEFQALGLIINTDKSQMVLAQEIVFLGFQMSSTTIIVSPPQEKMKIGSSTSEVFIGLPNSVEKIIAASHTCQFQVSQVHSTEVMQQEVASFLEEVKTEL